MENKSNFWSGFALGALILLALVTGALAFAMFRYRAVLPRLFAVLESAESTAPTSSATKPTGTAHADPSQADSSAADPTQAPEPAKSPEEYLDDLSRTLQELNRRIEAFVFNGEKITNYEMESAALQGLCALLGHRAMTVCSIIANRVATSANPNYKTAVRDLVTTVIERLTED